MPLHSITSDTTSSTYTAPLDIDMIQQERDKLCQARNQLSAKISNIKNTVTRLNAERLESEKNLIVERISFCNLRMIAQLHGENTPIRLKNDHFKYGGEASNFLKQKIYHRRYQAEREAAAQKFKVEGDVIVAGMAIKKQQEEIIKIFDHMVALEVVVGQKDKAINQLNVKKYNIEKKIDTLTEILADARKAEEKRQKIYQNFSMLYQSNAGCKAINLEARHLFGRSPIAGKINGSEIVEEYRRVHGDNIFSRGNNYLKSIIKFNCSNLSELVRTSAKEWYTPREKNITTYRGQGMTQHGLQKLVSQFHTDKHNGTETVYRLGQFFSTTTDRQVARDFANRSQDEAKVMFKVKGNSSNGLDIPGGLSFDNDEGEYLYSPLACFKVTAITRSPSNNTYTVSLEETSKANKVRLLPY